MLKDNDQSLNPTYTHETLEVAPPPSISENLTNTLNEIASVDPFICAENAIAHCHDQLRSNNVLHPSPSIRDALIAKYTYLLIECTNCQHSAYLPLSAINRPDDTHSPTSHLRSSAPNANKKAHQRPRSSA